MLINVTDKITIDAIIGLLLSNFITIEIGTFSIECIGLDVGELVLLVVHIV